MAADKKVPAVPESVLKKRKSVEKIQAARQQRAAAQKKANAAKRKVIFKRAEKYVREYRNAERDEVRLNRQAKAQGDFYVPAEAKVAFVIRMRGINAVSPKVRKVLQLLRLRQINNGVFVKLNKATVQMLRIVQPYIAWGYPNLKSVKELVYKRGHGKVKGARIPITDNRMIEQSLGKFDIICVEDLIHEIFTVGPHFKEASNFLWPFKLSNARGGLKAKNHHYIDGGDTGNHEEHINRLIRRMN